MIPYFHKSACWLLAISLLGLPAAILHAQPITTAGVPAQLAIRQAGDHSIRITLKPLSYKEDLPWTPALAERSYPAPVLLLTELKGPVKKQVGALLVEVSPAPLTVKVTTPGGDPIQQLVFNDDNTLTFAIHDAPVLGMGEGGHRQQQGANWRELPIEFDRRGRLQDMQPRWQGDAYGSRNPVALMVGTDGWALFVATPWGQVDLRAADHGVYLPWIPTAKGTTQQNEHNQGLAPCKRTPPAGSVIPGLYDLIAFHAPGPTAFMKD